MRHERFYKNLRYSATLFSWLIVHLACRQKSVSPNSNLTGNTYYLNVSGDDKNEGSKERPWQTIQKLNSTRLKPGDTVLLEGGQTFTGRIVVDSNESGTSDNPVVFASTGNAKAIINAGNESAMIVNATSYLHIHHLTLIRAGRKDGNTKNGVAIINGHHIILDNLEIKGFQKAGLYIFTSSDIRAEKVHAHENGFAGISVSGGQAKTDCHDVVVTNCVAENNPGDPTNFDNHSGNGIIAGFCKDVTIEYCAATNNGWDMPRTGNGPVGIWCYEADNVTIQHCISYRNKTAAGASDGGGYDLDGGVTNSVISAATSADKKIEYYFESVTIHPECKGSETDSRYDCFRKNFISIFQVNPFLKILSNNSSSDACAFTLFKYAEVAAFTPRLASGLTALDLVRMTLGRYLNGQKGYGMLGYDYDKTWDIPESASTCNSLDSYPSLLIAACTYITANNDKKWFTENYTNIKGWSDKMLASDMDNDGLLEFCLSGNSGSWKGDKTQRPANWWDTIGFGHKDAYSNALAYHALRLLAEVNTRYGAKEEASYFKEKAKKLKDIYAATFYNPATGILAGWKSTDGKLHDYYFTFVNGVAISYDLIETALANNIMDKLLLKMKAVGFTNFELGMPGNLIPVIRADYTDLLLEVGGGKRENNLDGFQIYENGGATSCFTYFTINALQKLGRKQDADAILLPLLKSMSEGNFQGRCASGRTKDWKTWTGECWGYEGFLVDNYMFLLAVLRQKK